MFMALKGHNDKAKVYCLNLNLNMVLITPALTRLYEVSDLWRIYKKWHYEVTGNINTNKINGVILPLIYTVYGKKNMKSAGNN